MENRKTYIIAEAGVNHNGDPEMASRMVEAAAKAGADAVKFQTFNAENLVTATAPKANYQSASTPLHETQLEMLKKLELDFETHQELLECCRRNKIDFISTPFDLDSVDLLIKLDLQTFKISSGDITNLPLLKKIGILKKKIIISTGMSNLGEISAALKILQDSGTPIDSIAVLHCNTEYPTPFEDVNLRAMLTIKKSFPDVRIGYSDHTQGTEIPIAAVALEAEIIEKHFTLDRNLPGPDQKTSLLPEELKNMVSAIRNIEVAMGNDTKKPSPSELENLAVVRKSIFANKVIKKGEEFTEENLTTLRPGNGISPMQWDKIIGTLAHQDFNAGDQITTEKDQ